MSDGARTRMVTALLLVVVFGSGIVVGFSVDHTAEASPPEGAVPVAEPDTADSPRTRRPRMYEQVGPSDAQRVVLDSIVVAHRRRMKDMAEEMRALYRSRERAIIESARASIKTVLTPAQAVQYDSILVDHDRRVEREANDPQ